MCLVCPAEKVGQEEVGWDRYSLERLYKGLVQHWVGLLSSPLHKNSSLHVDMLLTIIMWPSGWAKWQPLGHICNS